jgi:hypothetical protein
LPPPGFRSLDRCSLRQASRVLRPPVAWRSAQVDDLLEDLPSQRRVPCGFPLPLFGCRQVVRLGFIHLAGSSRLRDVAIVPQTAENKQLSLGRESHDTPGDAGPIRWAMSKPASIHGFQSVQRSVDDVLNSFGGPDAGAPQPPWQTNGERNWARCCHFPGR